VLRGSVGAEYWQSCSLVWLLLGGLLRDDPILFFHPFSLYHALPLMRWYGIRTETATIVSPSAFSASKRKSFAPDLPILEIET